MKISRRRFLFDVGIGACAATAASLLPIGRTSAAAPISTTNSLPDAGGFLRPYYWSACLPPQEWAAAGDWVMQKTLELLQPARWHSWGNWPQHGYPGRIPAIFSTQYFDHDSVLRRMQANSGEFWMTVNEPEMPDQCNESESAIADLVGDLIDIGRSADTEWQWGAPSVTLTANGGSGLRWLTEWNKIMRRRCGIAKPFAWMIHPYNSGSVSLFHASMDAWWEWYYRDNQGQGAPVVISEVCAEGSLPDVQADVMLECWKLLQNEEKVKGIFWFATYRSGVEEQRRSSRNPWQHYHLTTLDHGTQTVAFTELGQYWKELQNGLRTAQ